MINGKYKFLACFVFLNLFFVSLTAESRNSKIPPLSEEEVDRPTLEPARVDPRREQHLSLFVGAEQQRRLPFLPRDAKFEGDFRDVARVILDRDRNVLRFQPTSPGNATLTIHDGKGVKIYEFRLAVRQSNLTNVAREIRSLLNNIEGVTVKIINNRVVVDGQVLLTRDLSRVISVVGQYGDELASSLVTLSPLAQRKISQAIANDINNPEITVRAVNNRFILEGVANSEDERNRAFNIAQMYVPDVVKEAGEISGEVETINRDFVLNQITVRPPAPAEPGKIIQLVVHFVELNKNFQRGFRFQFTPSLSDESHMTISGSTREPSGVVGSLTAVVSNLLPKLNWARSHGHARVLQSTTLIVMDGERGDLRNTVRIPYTSVNEMGQMVTQFEEAGLISTITPEIVNPRSDSIRISMEFQNNSLIGQTNQGPMIASSSLNTVIVVRSGQSAAVGGLISSSTGTDYNKLPQGRAIDPIISLFASKEFRRDQSQFVVFVTPIIRSSASQGAEQIKEKFRIHD